MIILPEGDGLPPLFVVDQLSEFAQVAMDATLEGERIGVAVECQQMLSRLPCEGWLGLQ